MTLRGAARIIQRSKFTAPIDQGGDMRQAFIAIQEAFVTYSEGMTLASQNAQPWDPGACRRR
jgi:hypothetical protein